MSETQLQRPQMKIDAAPLSEEDRYNFLPYIDREAGLLPSEKDTWKTDEKAKAFMKALADGEDLTDTDWSGINLKGADLSGADLYGVNLSKANLMDANLSGANLKWANLSYAYCENTNFSNAKMQDTQMQGVFYKNCDIDGADIDEKTLKYLQSVEWFLSQIEKGKIKLDAIPQDQLNYLDLRTIDLSHVAIPENVDLSALILEGVNLSGVYIPKGHFLNMALLRRARLIMQRTKKNLNLMYIRLKNERQNAIAEYAKQQKQAELLKLDYAKNLPRPKKKTTVADDAPPQTDVNTSSGLTEQKSTAVHKLGWHKKRAELPKRSNVRLKRRA